jgi:hypothetical protein
MIHKLLKYLNQALEKPAPICAMILDPHIKLSYFEKNQLFFSTYQILNITPEDALKTFKTKAKSFYRSPSRMGTSASTQVEGQPKN